MIDKIIAIFGKNQVLTKLVITLVFLVITGILIFLAIKLERKDKSTKGKLKKLVALSILAAISVVLYNFLSFPLQAIIFFMPPFLKFHFSNIPIYIGGFLFGPLSGVIIAILRMVAKIPASKTMGVGELADLFIAVVTVLISSLIYHKYKTKKAAKVAMASSVLVWVITAILVNWLFIIPFFIQFTFAGDKSILINSLKAGLPMVNETNYMRVYLFYGALPFNLIMASVITVITFFTYKHISKLYGRIGDDGKEEIDVFQN